MKKLILKEEERSDYMSVSFEEVTFHLINDEKPSEYLNYELENGGFDKEPFDLLKKLRSIPQEKKHHPEGDVWVHTTMVVDSGAKYRNEVKDSKSFMWGLLLHDIGKIKTTKKRKGRWTSYNHDFEGESIGREFLSKICTEEEFISEVCKIIKYHMHYLYISKSLPYGDIEGLKRNCDVGELKKVFLADRLGRGGLLARDKEKITEEIKKFSL